MSLVRGHISLLSPTNLPSIPLGHVAGCGINDEISQWMDSIQNAAVDEEIPQPPKAKHRNISSFETKPENVQQNSIFNQEFLLPHEKYSRAANWRAQSNTVNDDDWHAQSHERVRRATRPKEENKNTCSLYIQTDPLIWRHIREGIADVSY